MESNDFNEKLQLFERTFSEDYDKYSWDMKVSKVAKTISYSVMIFLVYYVINTLLTYVVYSYSERKVAEIDYAKDPSDMKALKKIKEPIISRSTLSKVKKIIWLCSIIMVVAYLTSIVYQPVLSLPMKRAFNIKQAIWKGASGVALAYWVSTSGWYTAASFCQILQDYLNTGISLGTCAAMVVSTALAPFVQRYANQQVANLNTPDNLYAVENLQHQQLICGANQVRSNIYDAPDYMTYDLRPIHSAEYSTMEEGAGPIWWHIGHYESVRNTTKHVYAREGAHGYYDAYVMGHVEEDSHPIAREHMIKARQDDGAANLVYEFEQTNWDNMLTSPIANDECIITQLATDVGYDLTLDSDGTLDGCMALYDDTGMLGWSFVHITLSNTLEELNQEDRYEHFGECYNVAASRGEVGS